MGKGQILESSAKSAEASGTVRTEGILRLSSEAEAAGWRVVSSFDELLVTQQLFALWDGRLGRWFLYESIGPAGQPSVQLSLVVSAANSIDRGELTNNYPLSAAIPGIRDFLKRKIAEAHLLIGPTPLSAENKQSHFQDQLGVLNGVPHTSDEPTATA